MDVRHAFLDSAVHIALGFRELAMHRVVGNTALVSILAVNAVDRDTYADLTLPVIEQLRKVSASEFAAYSTLFHEGSIVLAHSWLEAFLAQVEEALYLADPSNLGESIQIKLGKVLDATSLDQLLHDLIRRRVRERSQWGLEGRVEDLRDRMGLRITVVQGDLHWASELRNNIVHNRRHGDFQVSKRKVTYAMAVRRSPKANEHDAARFHNIAVTLIRDLYRGTSSRLQITGRFARHRTNLDLIEGLVRAWPKPDKSTPKNDAVQTSH